MRWKRNQNMTPTFPQNLEKKKFSTKDYTFLALIFIIVLLFITQYIKLKYIYYIFQHQTKQAGMLYSFVMFHHIKQYCLNSRNFNRELFIRRPEFCLLHEKLQKTCSGWKRGSLTEKFPELLCASLIGIFYFFYLLFQKLAI